MFLYQNKIPADSLNNYLAMCKRLNASPSDMAICFKKESNFDPKAVNKLSKATGLIQFTRDTARELGTTTEALYAMSFTEQLVYVEKYLRLRIKERNYQPTDFYGWYFLIHYPVAAGKNDSYVLYSKYSSNPTKVLQYNQNKGIDQDGDGNVTVADIKNWLNISLPKETIQGAYESSSAVPFLFWSAIALLVTLIFKKYFRTIKF